MAKTLPVIRTEAQTIKNETTVGANTALRVGGTIEDIVDYIDDGNGLRAGSLNDELLRNTYLIDKKCGYYLNSSGVETANANYDIYTYAARRGMTKIHVSARVGAAAYVITYDTSGNIVSKYIGNSNAGLNFSKDIFIHEGVAFVRISAGNTETLTVTDAYAGKYRDIYEFTGDIVSSLGVTIPERIGYIRTDGAWGNTDNHYVIPVGNNDTIIVKTNSNQSSFVSFFSAYTAQANAVPVVSNAAGWTMYYELPVNGRYVIPIPNDAKYIYLSSTATRIPTSFVLTNCDNKMNGVKLDVIGERGGYYIDSSLAETSNSLASIVDYDVLGLEFVYIYGRLGQTARNTFVDANNTILDSFQRQFYRSGINTDAIYRVPTGAVKMRLSVARNYPTSVKDVSYDASNPDNMFANKRVAFIGDSITAGVGATRDEYRYSSIFSSLARCNEINLGVNGTCFADNTKNGKAADRFITRATFANIGDADVVFVFGGTNDFTYDVEPIGDLFVEETITGSIYRGTKRKIPPTNVDCFGAAVHELILQIRSVNPTARLIFITPMTRGTWQKAAVPPTSAETNEYENYLQDFIEAIRIICDFYAIPVVNMGALINQYWGDDTTFYSPHVLQSMDDDGIHPNDLGHERIGKCLYNYVIHNISI